MPFAKGRKKTGGKKKGVKPVIQSVREFLAERGSNPFETLDDIRRGELTCNVCRGKKKTRYQPGQGDKTFERTCQSCYGSGFERINPADRARAAGELAKYCQPQLKAIEVSGNQDRPVLAEIRVRFVEAKDGKPAE
jgi:DnaJ-class molecular chaperone